MITYLLSAVAWNDVKDGVYVLIGAILGVLSSLLIAWASKKYGIHRLKKMLKIELVSIKQGVLININSNGKIEFPSPLWNFLGQTQTLLDLSEDDYKKVVSIHGAIRYFVEYEEKGDRDPIRRQKLIDAINENAL